MLQINPYLIFNGDCEAAFQLYKTAFGGEFEQISKFGDIPSTDGSKLSDIEANKIMHVSFPIGNGSILMGSDTNSASGDCIFGDNVSISINATNRVEADHLFNTLSDGGVVKMPMQDTFWGAYFGMLIDKFGVNWMINFDDVKKS